VFDEELQNVPKEWWRIAQAELNPGGSSAVMTVAPLCEKHARRLRRSLSERLLRIEERLDDIEKERELEEL